ncbi:BTB/POZ protein [Rhizophagus irregularis DAOM 181602=DAOM 197198]|nr:BTB/POZ protein [Rhizophagus irregularis DAOM 181602=DAOM 197198]
MCYRSPYLQRTYEKNRGNDLAQINLPSIHPEIFHVILEYIYGGVLSLNERDTSDKLKILVAAEVLCLQELVDYLQKYLIENKSEWLEQNFGITYQASSKSNNLLKLHQFCTNLMANSPEKIFESFDFTLLTEKTLVQLIKRDGLQMKEIEIWEYLLNWGLAKNPTLIPDPETWTDNDFKTMKNTLQNCLPSIRFFSMSSKEFFSKVRPYKKLFNNQLFEELIQSYMDPDSKPNENISPPRRNIKIDGIIDSKINKFIEDIHISNVENVNYALDYSPKCGPKFGSDIFLHASDELKNYDNIYYRKCFYENSIRDTEEKFLIGDYEIFQINKVTICPD